MKRNPVSIRRARDLRVQLTNAEVLMWNVLRNRQIDGVKFRRQHAIGPFIADFYCASLRLAIEIDGSSHEDRGEHDGRKDAYLRSLGVEVLRFQNEDVERNLEGVWVAINQMLARRTTGLGSNDPSSEQ